MNKLEGYIKSLDDIRKLNYIVKEDDNDNLRIYDPYDSSFCRFGFSFITKYFGKNVKILFTDGFGGSRIYKIYKSNTATNWTKVIWKDCVDRYFDMPDFISPDEMKF